MKRLFIVIICNLVMMRVMATDVFVNFKKGDWLLNENNKVSIYVSSDEERGVMLAAQNLKNDIEKVCNAEVVFVNTPNEARIVAGTAHKLKIHQRTLKDKTEQYILDARQGQLYIVGSDRRGAIYGIYELSRQIGVSPWYYWADVPISQHPNIFINNGLRTDGEPAVKFRGIFLNDEAPCLTSWVKNTFGTNYGDHHFYEKVFELILRLKGNMLWPAMWCWAFYADDPLNGPTADQMGVIVGTSHHEPMARNHQEYARRRREWGPWNYETNQQKLDQFFREGIERMKNTDDIVTIGMRGDGDSPMSQEADTKLMKRIIDAQRRIIKEVTGKPAEKTTQVWALYKEVQDYYDAGLRVPDDVMILVSDDNWGNIRRVPTAAERNRKGGWGIYYHVDYVGAPRNTKWLNVTQTQQMFEQLSLAYDYGIQRMWILNVGDLKPMEYPITLFMDMAWKPKEYTIQNITDHTYNFFENILNSCSTETIKEAADIYNRNCKYMACVTPEMLDMNTYNIKTGEWRQVTDDYQRLELRALRLYEQIPTEARDAYRQLLLFPIQGMANLYDMYYAQAMNHYLAEMGAPEANEWAERVKSCFERDSLLCVSYNRDIANGKWNGMMTQKHIGYTSWDDDFLKDILPTTKKVSNTSQLGGYTYHHSLGYVSMEAERFFSTTTSKGTTWSIYPHYGRSHSAVALTPYTLPVGDASLTYRFSLPKDAQHVKIHVIVKSTLDFLNVGGHEYTVCLDGSKPETINFNKTLIDRKPYMYSEFYPTVARRVVEKVVELPVNDTTDIHELIIHPRHPGIVFEKIIVDYGGYSPSYLYGKESEFIRK